MRNVPSTRSTVPYRQGQSPSHGYLPSITGLGYDLIMALRERMRMSIILIAHSMGLVAQTCDRVGVMYAGNLVEVGGAVPVFKEPQHPFPDPRGNSAARPIARPRRRRG